MENSQYRQEAFSDTQEESIVIKTEDRSYTLPGTFENKHKERLPEDTIKIIEDFFKDLGGYEIRETHDYDTGIGVYSCTIKLFYKGYEIGVANGKGTTRLFSKASAYAELYERYCLFEFHVEPASILALYENEEKWEDMDNLIDFPRAVGETGKKDVLKKTFRYIHGDRVPVLEFESLTGDEPAYTNPTIQINLNGSNGMAAGNTLEEALVQGYCELMERFVEHKVFYGSKILSKISSSLIKKVSPWVYEKIQEINESGFSIYFYDASQATGLPVIVSLCIDKNCGKHYINMGSSPCFEIALERTITETFQGIGNLNLTSTKFIPNFAFTDRSMNAYEKFTMNGMQISSEEPFMGAAICDEVNELSYVSKDADNIELLDKIRQIASRYGIRLYHRDFGLCKNMKAVYCISPELNNILVKDGELLSDEGIRTLENFVAFIRKKKHTYGECIRMLEEMAAFLPVQSRVIHNAFYYSPLQKHIIYYIQFALYLKLGEFQKAEEIGKNDLSEAAKKIPEIMHMISYISYVNAGKSKEQIAKIMDLWEVPKDLATTLLGDTEDFDEKFIFEMIFGESFEKRKKAALEILDHAKKLRERL